jgi:hypothetical protein
LAFRQPAALRREVHPFESRSWPSSIPLWGVRAAQPWAVQSVCSRDRAIGPSRVTTSSSSVFLRKGPAAAFLRDRLVWGITGWTLVVSELPAQRGGLVTLLFVPAGGFPYPNSRKPARRPSAPSTGFCGGPLSEAALPSITVLLTIAIIHFVQRSWPAEILITSGGALRSIAVPSRGKIRRAKKAAHNPAPAGGRLRRHQRWR